MTPHDIPALLERLAGRRVVASISGGKDSGAMSLYLRELGIEHDRVFMDTGWEHPATYEYLRGELTAKIGPIIELRGKRDMVELIRSKQTFPGRLRRFCTQQLKVAPLQAYFAERADDGVEFVNAVGIRAAESAKRAAMPEWEWSNGFDCETWRPLITWTVADVIEIHRRHDLRPNPLYLLGATRVGCWPCVYARKAEVRMVANLSPERIDLIRELEAELTEQSGSQRAWFQSRLARTGLDAIDDVVEWSKTDHGGRQFEMFAADPADEGCMRWGLCETDSPPKEQP